MTITLYIVHSYTMSVLKLVSTKQSTPYEPIEGGKTGYLPPLGK